MLIEAGELAAVVDWDAAGPGRLPYSDLLHLRLNANRPRGPWQWGRALLDQALPAAATGGDAVDRRYCEAVGVDPSAELLTALVAAYWLSDVAGKLERYKELAARPVWMASTVTSVLPGLLAALER